MVSVSLPAGHLFDFDHDRAAAHNSEINICPHCFFTLIALILFLRTADCGLRTADCGLRTMIVNCGAAGSGLLIEDPAHHVSDLFRVLAGDALVNPGVFV